MVASNTSISYYDKSVNAFAKKELSTRRTLHADVNTRKGANGELFIDSIPDSLPKINSFDKNSSKMLIRVKKQSSSQYLADLKIRKAYVQDVKENYSTTSILDSAQKSNSFCGNKKDRGLEAREYRRRRYPKLSLCQYQPPWVSTLKKVYRPLTAKLPRLMLIAIYHKFYHLSTRKPSTKCRWLKYYIFFFAHSTISSAVPSMPRVEALIAIS